jgi:hypothetical protein
VVDSTATPSSSKASSSPSLGRAGGASSSTSLLSKTSSCSGSGLFVATRASAALAAILECAADPNLGLNCGTCDMATDGVAFRVLSSEVSLVEDDHESAPVLAPLEAGSLSFCFDVMVAGSKLAALQFQNSACSAVSILQEQAGEWVCILPWTPLLLHDYRDEAELEAWHLLPVDLVSTRSQTVPPPPNVKAMLMQFGSKYRVEPMAHLRVCVQYRAVEGIEAHQLRHVRCLRAVLPAGVDIDGHVLVEDAAADPTTSPPDVMPTRVATTAVLLSEALGTTIRGTP